MMIIAGLCFFANIWIIIQKLRRRQLLSAAVDTGVNILVIGIIGATQGELIMALVASTCMSVYLWLNPFEFDKKIMKKAV
jgi:hypothetical protein